jgi:hypothetical protein
MAKAKRSWTEVSTLAEDRTKQLDASLALQHFLGDHRDQKAWCALMDGKVAAVDPPLDVADVASAVSAVKLLEGYRNEMEHPSRVAERDAFLATGNALVNEGHYAYVNTRAHAHAHTHTHTHAHTHTTHTHTRTHTHTHTHTHIHTHPHTHPHPHPHVHQVRRRGRQVRRNFDSQRSN